ncbi:MAG: hypothetical protein KF906_10315 [Actinobacteria bacterium]|nr:hypothetical protein [Actinomycetota bacterium]
MPLSLRRSLVVATVVLAVGLAGCGSSSSDASSDGATTEATTAADGASTTTADSSGGGTAADPDVDPCTLYSTDDMAEQMGADDVTAEAFDGVSPTCTYTSAAHYLEAELAVLDADQMAALPRDPTAYLTDEAAAGVEVLDVSGIGDEVFGSTSAGGVSLAVRTGETGYTLLLTNAGGGADAGNWSDDAAMFESAKAILTDVVAG